MRTQPDRPAAWRVVDADTGALVARVPSRTDAVRIVCDAPDPARYVIEPPAAEDEAA
jgi:hypothetical protein